MSQFCASYAKVIFKLSVITILPWASFQVAFAEHICAIINDGRVKCWGKNDEGQLGLGDRENRGQTWEGLGDDLPTVNLGNFRAKQISLGQSHTCALSFDHRIKCWGKNDDRQLGLPYDNSRGTYAQHMGDALPDVYLGEEAHPIQVAAARTHTCALFDNGRVKCWGNNMFGQLGQEVPYSRLGGSRSEMDRIDFIDLGEGLVVTQIAAGGSFNCALFDSGKIKCWGLNAHGQLGIPLGVSIGENPGDMGDNLPFVNLGEGITARRISAGNSHVCAILSDHRMKCWGYNVHGMLGLGDDQKRGREPEHMGDNLPFVDVGVSDSGDVKSVSAGGYHTCVLVAANKVKCWGANFYGETGSGDTIKRGLNPDDMGSNLQYVNLDQPVIKLQAGYDHTCVTLINNTAKCWGLNTHGQLGIGSTENIGDDLQDVDMLPFAQLGFVVVRDIATSL